MKIKSNVRAGAGNGNGHAKQNSKSNQAAGTVVFYIPPVSRCVGI